MSDPNYLYWLARSARSWQSISADHHRVSQYGTQADRVRSQEHSAYCAARAQERLLLLLSEGPASQSPRETGR